MPLKVLPGRSGVPGKCRVDQMARSRISPVPAGLEQELRTLGKTQMPFQPISRALPNEKWLAGADIRCALRRPPQAPPKSGHGSLRLRQDSDLTGPPQTHLGTRPGVLDESQQEGR